MGKRLELIGKTFGRLSVISCAGSDKHKKTKWLCVCLCGKSVEVIGSDLVSGKTKSCGCYQKDNVRKTHGKTGTKEYRIWSNMKKRCLNPKDERYKDYGGRGITIYPLWLSFQNFFNDLGYCPKNCTLDRINNDKGYSLENCRWVDNTTQRINQRRPSLQGVTFHTVSQKWVARIGERNSRKYLGIFSDWFEAVCARKSAEAKSEYSEIWNKIKIEGL